MTMQTFRTPYRRRQYGEAPRQGPAWCDHCQAIRRQRRWFLDPAARDEMMANPKAIRMLCPGCLAIEDSHYEGELELHAAWPEEKWQEVVAVMRHVEEEELLKNPLSRIGSMDGKPEDMTVMTTTGFLAHRLGRALYKAFKGHLEVELAAGEGPTRILWTGPS